MMVFERGKVVHLSRSDVAHELLPTDGLPATLCGRAVTYSEKWCWCAGEEHSLLPCPTCERARMARGS